MAACWPAGKDTEVWLIVSGVGSELAPVPASELHDVERPRRSRDVETDIGPDVAKRRG